MRHRSIALLSIALLIAACSPGSIGSPTAGDSFGPEPSPAGSVPEMTVEPSIATGDVNDITVTALEYTFVGIPDAPWTGMVLHLDNVGKEAHTMIVVRKNEGVSTSIDDLMKDPMAALASVTVVGWAAADPGQKATQTVTLDQPGDYAVFDLTPSGTTQLPTAGSASPDASGGPLPSGLEGFPFPLPATLGGIALPSLGPGASFPVGTPDILLGMLKTFTVTALQTPGPAASPEASTEPMPSAS